MKIQFPKVEPPPWVSAQDWLDWKWQLKNSLKSEQDYEQFFSLSSEEIKAFREGSKVFQIRSTPYYANLANKTNVQDPLRRMLVPHYDELVAGAQQMLDPLGERKHSPTARIIHRYSDRVLFLVTDQCSVYCRYCTRKHFTGQDQAIIKKNEYQQGLKYIESHQGIREVILSGGDPLTLGDGLLESILFDLRKIEHIEIIRIGTRIPVVLPMRVSESLVKMIRKYSPVFLMTHFNHPQEITQSSAEALALFVDHGIPVFNQMVLLNGINNHAAIVQALSRRLLFLRVKPYYMFQCDPSNGTDHLRTSIEDSLSLQKELWGHLSGLAMPNLSMDIPEGGGKVPLVPNFLVQDQGDKKTYRGWDGIESEYINPQRRQIGPNVAPYIDEWNRLKK